MKTDDRMRLAKERREERERSLGTSMYCFCSQLLKFVCDMPLVLNVVYEGASCL